LTLLQSTMLVPQPAAEAAVLIALYTVAAYSDRRRAALAFGVIEAIVAGMVLAMHVHLDSSIGRFLLISAFVTAAFVLGTNVRTRRAYLASMEDRAIRAERERDQQSQIAAARERALIAREMHDIVAHNLSVMIALADGAAFAVRPNPDAAETAARHVSETGRQALEEMHRLLGVLRGTGEESPRAPQPGITQIDELVGQVRTAGLPVSWTVTGQRFPLSPTAELTVYRVAQEALTNVLKHATTPSEAQIRLTYAAPVVTLEITDDGAGPMSTADTGTGHGLSGMRERVAVLDGDVEAGPQPGGGWRVATRIGSARIPAPAALPVEASGGAA
jgi:signal transduction histidine kinase